MQHSMGEGIGEGTKSKLAAAWMGLMATEPVGLMTVIHQLAVDVNVCARVKIPYIGDGHPTFTRESL